MLKKLFFFLSLERFLWFFEFLWNFFWWNWVEIYDFETEYWRFLCFKIIKKPVGPPPSLNFFNSLVSGATNMILAFGAIGANVASAITSGIKGVWHAITNEFYTYLKIILAIIVVLLIAWLLCYTGPIIKLCFSTSSQRQEESCTRRRRRRRRDWNHQSIIIE